MRKQRLTLCVAVTGFCIGMSMTALAGEWKQNNNAYWYQEDNGSYPANTWKWINGKCYYFDENGYMLHDTTTPDGNTVDASGAWVVNDVVQTQSTTQENTAVHHNANYDPAHPLAGKIDEWHLRLTPESNALNTNYITTPNVHAMLTGQMEYYVEPTGYGVEEQKETEQALYNWFCNWLNGMDFENMSEMDRAKAIRDVLGSATYSLVSEDTYIGQYWLEKSDPYRVIILKKGRCAEFAMTARYLAKSMGLKSAVYGSGEHAVYYIQVDGTTYTGSNQDLYLDFPHYNQNIYYNND
ncbi:hypothetical protein [uncultured Clostridium sp.]|uniref:hypothetical protein n=1 Tax=uncultured Clostridium sp. TaxID=59620 RepID=UPI00266B5638|nr:hypothetical protein [uncultured Clostridium sp.]